MTYLGYVLHQILSFSTQPITYIASRVPIIIILTNMLITASILLLLQNAYKEGDKSPCKVCFICYIIAGSSYVALFKLS